MTKNNKIGHKLFSILLILGIFFTSCENPSGPNSPVNPIGANDGAKDNDGNVTSSLVNAEKKAGDDGFIYIYDGDFSYEAKDSAGGWKNITEDVLNIEAAGEDKVLKISYDLQGSQRQLEIGFLLNNKNISESVWETKLFIPDSYATPGEAAYPVLQLWGKYGDSWTATSAIKLNTITIGSGWHTITVDIKNSTVKIDGNTVSTLSTGETVDISTWKENLTAAKSVGFTFYGDGIPTAMEGDFYIDYVNLSGLSQALPESPTVTCTNNTVEIKAEEGTVVYYTTNSEEPTEASTKYTAPFAITETTTVKAIAVKDGLKSLVATKECSFVETGSQGSAKLTFSETASEKKPNFYFRPSEGKVLKSVSFKVYAPAATQSIISGGKAYFKTGDWVWNEGNWTNLSADSWVEVTATYDGEDVVKEIGFNGYGNTDAPAENLSLYFDDFIVTYADETTETFDFNSGIPTGFDRSSDSAGTGEVSHATDVYYQ